MTYFLDTNIISALLKGDKRALNKIDEITESGSDIFIPSIAYYEIKRGLIASGATTKLAQFLNFANVLGVVDLSMPAVDFASQVYAELKTAGNLIEDDDIFIGATAFVNNGILVTDNIKHLSRIKNLKLEDWLK